MTYKYTSHNNHYVKLCHIFNKINNLQDLLILECAYMGGTINP